MKNIKCTIAYDGTSYLGWQKTKEGPSIEEELEKALSQILQEEISLQAASRTDRGVHAKGQTVNFFTLKNPDLKKLQKSLNQLLPKDIAVITMQEEREAFHPTLDAKGKEYIYEVFTADVLLPHSRSYVWHYPYDISLEKMVQGKEFFLGKKNFASFCNIRTDDALCEISKIEIFETSPQFFRFHIFGNRFLYKMARTIVGTLIYIGRGKISPAEIESIFHAEDRTLAGITAPAHGLFLAQVFY
jgi:tRNA pseudouridine38-40 synthase